MNLEQTMERIERDRGLEVALMAEIIASRKKAWLVAGVGLALAFLAVLAVVLLTPLKAPPEMYVVRVNDTTGEVENVSRLGVHDMDYGEAVSRFYISRYLQVCESYSWFTVQDNFNACQLMSADGGPRESHARRYSINEKDSITNRLGQSANIRVDIGSITFTSDGYGSGEDSGTAVVRFSRTEESLLGAPIKPTEYVVATISYYYPGRPMKETSRRVNPLGFEVLSYQVDVDPSHRN